MSQTHQGGVVRASEVDDMETDDFAPDADAASETDAEVGEFDNLPDGVRPGMADDARRALHAILTRRYVWRERHKPAWEGVIAYEEQLRERLHDMFLDLVVDRDAGVAFKRQQEGEDSPRMLRRDRPLSRDASLVILFLRREYGFADDTSGAVMVTRDQISEFLRAFREEGDGDDAGFSRRVDAAINVLIKPWQLLEPDDEADYLLRISPVIEPLLGVDEITRLEQAFRRAAAGFDLTEPGTEEGVQDALELGVPELDGAELDELPQEGEQS